MGNIYTWYESKHIPSWLSNTINRTANDIVATSQGTAWETSRGIVRKWYYSSGNHYQYKWTWEPNYELSLYKRRIIGR